MKVTQEKLPRSQVGLHIEVEGERSKQAYDRLVSDRMRTARIPGFRPGKAPRQLVLQFYGKDYFRALALESLIDSSIKEALEQEAIQSLGSPQLRDRIEELMQRFEPGQPISFNAAVDVQPEVNLKQYAGLAVQYEEVPYDPAEVDGLLERYREQRAVKVPVEGRPAASGDVAMIDFVGTRAEDGSEIQGARGSDFEVELLPNRMIPGFVEGIEGMSIGENKTLEVSFPDDYVQKDLAGVAARFEITLKDLKSKELPALDDDFAQDISEFETLADLRAFLEKQQQEQAAERSRANRDGAILKAIVAQTEVDLPETLLEREIQFLAEQNIRQLQQQGIDPSKIYTQENIPRLREVLRGDAENRLKRTLALAQVARLEKIQVEEAQVQERATELRNEVLDGEGVSDQALVDYAREELLTEKILDWLAEHSTIEVLPPGTASQTASSEAAEAPAEPADSPPSD